MNPLIDILQLVFTFLGLALIAYYVKRLVKVIDDYNLSLTDEERRELRDRYYRMRGDYRQDNPPSSFWDKGESPTEWPERIRAVNTRAQSGCSRCECGNKYWEDDKCIDCNTEHDPILHDTFEMWTESLQSSYLFDTFIPAMEGRKFTPYDFDAQGTKPHSMMHMEFVARLSDGLDIHGASAKFVHFHMLHEVIPDCDWNLVATPGTGGTENEVPVAMEITCDEDTDQSPLGVVQVDWTGRLEEDIRSYLRAVFGMAMRHDILEELWPTWNEE